MVVGALGHQPVGLPRGLLEHGTAGLPHPVDCRCDVGDRPHRHGCRCACAARHPGHRMGGLHLPPVLDPARLERPEQQSAEERAECGRIRHLVGDVRKFARPRAVELGARRARRRGEDGEGAALRVGGIEHGPELELLNRARLPAPRGDRVARAVEVGHRVAAEQRPSIANLEDADALPGVGHQVGGRIVGPAEHVAVERRRPIGVGCPHRYVAHVTVLNGGGRTRLWTGQHPAVAERVDDACVARTVVLVRLALDAGAAVPGPSQCDVGVSDVQHQAHRSGTRNRCPQPDLRILVGQVEHAAGKGKLRMPNSTVVHDNWLADGGGSERVGIPGDRRARVGDGQVWQYGRPGWCRRLRSVLFNEFVEGGLGPTHGDSLRSGG